MQNSRQAWTNCAPNADRTRSSAQNLLDTPEKFGAHILHCKKQKTIRSTSFQSNLWNNEKVTVNYKYYPGLFPGKSAATFFNNKTELFEKAKGQGPESFRLLSFRFLGYERPPETLQWEHLTINKSSSEG